MAVGALYIHVPFCASKCVYCDFDSRACTSETAFDRYVDRMLDRIGVLGSAGALQACKTIYIGGGTPTVLGPRLAGLAAALRDVCPVCEEFSCEANPESLSSELAFSLSKAGVTRISFGVQSFIDDELKALGRIHDAQRAREAVATAKAAGLATSLDLMCGIPLQTMKSWTCTLDQAIACDPDHISVYPLTIEEDTPLYRAALRDESLEPDEDFQADCMQRARQRFRGAGYLPYEVASYAKPGCSCRHNVAYWTGISYLGMGRSAASMLDRATYEELSTLLGLPDLEDADSVRFRFVEGADGAISDASFERLDAREASSEDLMLAMRMTRGASAELLRRAMASIGTDAVSSACEMAVAEGLAGWEGAPFASNLAPTARGWLMGNQLFELMWDLASS